MKEQASPTDALLKLTIIHKTKKNSQAFPSGDASTDLDVPGLVGRVERPP